MSLDILLERAQLLHDTRDFFYRQQVMEVETPALSQGATTDPYIDSFAVEDHDGIRYLQTSAEYPMKRLLAAGSGDIFQICKVWRMGEIGRHHHPEFTMLEWYRVAYRYKDLMQEVDTLLQRLIPHLAKTSDFISYQDAFQKILRFNPHTASHSVLMACLREQSIDLVSTKALDNSAILDILMTHCIEPSFSQQHLTFIYDYPACQKALSCLSQDETPVAQRFEVYLGEVELGNAYQEEVSAKKNRQQLQSDLECRLSQNKASAPVDERFLQALEVGMPECAGIAIGLDRVLMCRCQKNSLEDIIALPWVVA
ncbi:MAG: EF-P lysine aminoacylase GenX [Thiotrichaceae bacterium]|nr:EF-P lysine aminoacylase GenX [Thiotrichaceae bacterium]